MQRDLNELSKKMIDKKDISWEDKKKAEDLLNKQKELEKKLEELRSKNEQKNRQQEEYKKVNEDIAQKQEQLQKIMDKMQSPELKKLIEQLQKLMQNVDKNQLQQQLSELKLDNKDLQKDLERTIELFKQMEFEQKLQDNIDKLNDLSKKQDELSKKSDDKAADNKDLKEYVKARTSKGNNKFILNDFSVKPFSTTDKVMNIQTNFEVPGYGKKIADEVYINMALDKTGNLSLLDTAQRKIAVECDFKFHVKNYTILDIPAGYEVSYIPEDYAFKNDLYSFNLKYLQKGQKITAEQDFKSEVMLLDPKDFGQWNATVKELNNQRKKQLVLKKK